MSSFGSQDFNSEKNTILFIYILHALGFFTGGLTSIAAIIMNYVKLDDIKNPISVSHFKWQMRTFWWGVLWSLVSLILAYFIIGLLGFVVIFFWFVYRLVAGMVNLNKDKGMYGVA
ncbi:hypothetical protein CLH62_12585 [Marinobacter guineae]|uniref:Transmembrane protein n=1 Tax=Marinobacter guineae TaxID=432303 RepID=A0A2G1VEH0_9GAMM|nr:hypothetical protein [Marinobacter guineae]PHQ25178.1 hypothetical protein CLH62_12585 [Marinobacter guineae]